MTFSDLHRHLDGSLRLSTLYELAERYSIQLPVKQRDLFFYPNMGLKAALDCFALTLSVLQNPSDVQRVASEICEDARSEDISALEIRFAPQLHQNAPVEDIVDAALDGIKGRAGLILCGLYGENPKTIFQLVEVARTRPQIVGIDLAGGPAPFHQYHLEDYQAAFKKAREYGIGRTVHAGEGRSAFEIKKAIEILYAQRIGHGTTLFDEPEVVDMVVANGVTIEVNITSNVHTGVIANAASHPLVKWLKRGVKACICTDNTLLSQTNLPAELDLAVQLPGMTPKLLEECRLFGLKAAFPQR